MAAKTGGAVKLKGYKLFTVRLVPPFFGYGDVLVRNPGRLFPRIRPLLCLPRIGGRLLALQSRRTAALLRQLPTVFVLQSRRLADRQGGSSTSGGFSTARAWMAAATRESIEELMSWVMSACV